MKLNLCSQYKVTQNVDFYKPFGIGLGDTREGGFHEGECVGKTEIDSAEAKWVGVAEILHLTLWESVYSDAILKVFSAEGATDIYGGDFLSNLGLGTSSADYLKLKNHDKNIEVSLWSASLEFFSYTKRF